MKITDVHAIYPNYPQPPGAWRKDLWQIVLRIDTDAGIVGYGYGGGGRAAVPIVNGHFRELLLGRTVDCLDDIRAIWDDLYAASIPYGRKGIAIMALSGVDLAMWDLLARAEGVPVYQLLGGLRKARLRAYASGRDPEWYAELGYTAHKAVHRWTGDPADYDAAVATAARARQFFGVGTLLMFDCYMSWDAPVTLEMAKRLADYDIHWFEDVATPDDLGSQASLREGIGPINLAGGEHEFTHHGFADIARTQALDIWQPDVTWCGGITATLRILDLAREANAEVVLHRGGEVWGAHLIAATDCGDLAEVLPGRRGDSVTPLWLDEPQARDGTITLSDRPGFGVAPNAALLG